MQYTRDFYNDKGELTLRWLHLLQPNNNEIRQVLDEFSFPEDFITSGLDPDEVPRIETYQLPGTEKTTDEIVSPGEVHLYVFLHPFYRENNNVRHKYETMPFSVILMDDLVITTANTSIPNLRDLYESNSHEVTDEISFMLHLFWKISLEYTLLLGEISDRVQELEVESMNSTGSDILYKLLGINKGLIYFETAIEGNTDILKEFEGFLDDVNRTDMEKKRELLRDAQVEHHQAKVMVYQIQKLADKLTDVLSNIISNNMNTIMKIMTSWTIILTVPTIIGGLWGMNVAVPMENNTHAFIILSLLTLVIVALVYWLLKKKDMM